MLVLELEVLGRQVVFENLESALEARAVVVSVGGQSEVGMRIV